MKCPKCQIENSDTRKFCSDCGAKLLRVCPQCGFLRTAWCKEYGNYTAGYAISAAYLCGLEKEGQSWQ